MALSGGGHRASLFTLGVLLYLVDAGKNTNVNSIASVSGGSLTNGVVAQDLDYTTSSREEFSQLATRLATRIARKGTLWASWTTWAYLACLVAFAAAALVAVWFLPTTIWLRLPIFFAALLALGVLAQQRGRVCVLAFRRTLYSPNDRPTRLREIHQTLDHVFCATDLHAGEHVYFSRRFVCSYRYGLGIPADLTLDTVVQASASYPGGFPAAWLPTRPHRFQQPQDESSRSERSMVLVDGGVYDNMADQWGEDVPRRNSRWHTLNPRFQEPDQLIVVNSSAPMRWRSQLLLRVPLLGEALTLKRDLDVLYDNTTTPRRRLLNTLFTNAARQHSGLQGTVVQIAQSPFHLPEAFAHGTGDDPPALRGRNVLAALGDTHDEWETIVADDSRVPTTFSRISPPRATQLLRHGYTLAMVNLHVLLNYPLLTIPTKTTFDHYVSNTGSAST